jgi:hypothetical protein
MLKVHDSVGLSNGLRTSMSRRRIGQESFGFGAGGMRRGCSLDNLGSIIDWAPVERTLADISSAAKGEPAWPPVALFKALLISIWYDRSDVKLAEALGDRSSFRRFCGFSSFEPTPERTAFVRFRRALVERQLDKLLFEAITAQLKAEAIRVGSFRNFVSEVMMMERRNITWQSTRHYWTNFSTAAIRRNFLPRTVCSTI